MPPKVHWIETPLPGKLGIVPRPRAGDWLADEIAGWKAGGIDLVASLLEPHEVAELGLYDEASLCDRHTIEFVSFPVPDRGVPTSRLAVLALAQLLASRISQGGTAAVHCRAGIGRSSVIAACALICLGMAPDQALDLLAKARGVDVPDTAEQRAWVQAFADWQQSVGSATLDQPLDLSGKPVRR
jgi:protein-tyrosine phosphatase